MKSGGRAAQRTTLLAPCLRDAPERLLAVITVYLLVIGSVSPHRIGARGIVRRAFELVFRNIDDMAAETSVIAKDRPREGIVIIALHMMSARTTRTARFDHGRRRPILLMTLSAVALPLDAAGSAVRAGGRRGHIVTSSRRINMPGDTETSQRNRALVQSSFERWLASLSPAGDNTSAWGILTRAGDHL